MVRSNRHSNQSATQLTITSSLRSSPRDLPQKDGCCALVRNMQITMHAPMLQVILNSTICFIHLQVLLS